MSDGSRMAVACQRDDFGGFLRGRVSVEDALDDANISMLTGSHSSLILPSECEICHVKVRSVSGKLGKVCERSCRLVFHV